MKHIQSPWSHGLIARTAEPTTNTRIDHLRGVGGVVTLHPSLKKRSGDLASMQKKVVGKECNETWMSGLETEVIEPLTFLIQGRAQSF